MKKITRGFLVLFLAIITCFVFAVSAEAAGFTIAWNASTDSSVTGYKVCYGFSSRNYPNTVDVGNVTTYTFSSITPGAVYYLSVVAYDSSGNQSPYSPELTLAPGGYLLWTNSSGQAIVQELDVNYAVVDSIAYGPYTNWKPLSFVRGTGGTTGYFLWNSSANQADLWTMGNGLSTYTTFNLYGPYSNYTPLSFSFVGSEAYLLWKRLSDGAANLWHMLSDLSGYASTGNQMYGPYSGYTPTSLINSLTWSSSGGIGNVWLMNSDLSGPSTNGYWVEGNNYSIVTSCCVGSALYVLWRRSSDNAADLWIGEATSIQNKPPYYNYVFYSPPASGFYPIGYYKDLSPN
jgi:hypothetical protein